jgi:hypothetical protein
MTPDASLLAASAAAIAGNVPAIAIPVGLADYPGAKGGEGVYHTIISQMPPHEVYIEPFVGSGAVLRFKRPAAFSIAVDADAMVIGYWQRSERARRPDRRDASPTFICGDGIRFLAEYPWKGGELVYCDPPYLMETRSCQRDYYRKEFTDEDHKRLLAVLVELPCPVLLSGYWSTLYDEALQGWRLLTFQTMTHRGVATECLWMNFPPPCMLHDYQYLGAGYRERERIKRKKLRWQKMLSKMPALERAAVIEAVEEMKREKGL